MQRHVVTRRFWQARTKGVLREEGDRVMGKLSLVAGILMIGLPAFSPGGDAAAEKKDSLAPLARFAGEWEVDGQWSSGEALHARGVYEWGLGKKILRARTFVGTGDKEYQRYESVMTWHPKKQCLYEITFAYDGNISEVVIDPKDEDTLHIGYTPFHADQPQNVRQILKFKDNDHFVWTVNIKQGDEWKQIMEATWVRKNAKAR
jgi:hypothetical protein